MLIQIFFWGAQLDIRVGVERKQDIPKKSRSFKPPVAKQFGIEAGHYNAMSSCLLMIFNQAFFYQMAKMLAMLIYLAGNIARTVWSLVIKTELCVGYFPIAQPTSLAIPFVKLQIYSVGRVANKPAPNLPTYFRVTDEGSKPRRTIALDVNTNRLTDGLAIILI